MKRSGSAWTVLDRVTTVAMLVAAVVVLARNAVPEATVPGTIAPSPVEAVSGSVPPEVVKAAGSKGSEKAKIVLVEFTDYQCPFCRRNAKEVHPELTRSFVDTGRAKFIVLNFPLETIHPDAMKAAEAAECASEQGKLWEMHDALFENQSNLRSSELIRHANAIELHQEQFESCLGGSMRARVDGHIALARQLGVSSTPVFFIGDIQPDQSISLRQRITGAAPLDVFERALEQSLAEPSLWTSLRALVGR